MAAERITEDVPCPIANTPACPVYGQEGECYEDTHHLWYPASEYKTKVEKQFRRLGSQTIEICRNLHNIEHVVWIRTPKPDREFMLRAIQEENARKGQ